MNIKVDGERLGSGKKIIEHKGKKAFIRIPIKFENWKEQTIKHYRIDKIEIIDGDAKESPPPKEKENILEKFWGNLKNIKKIWNTAEGKSSKKITGYRTPEKSEKVEIDQTEQEKITTKVVKHEDLLCEAIFDDKEIFKKTGEQNKYKMDLALLPESGSEIKREIIFELESEPEKKPKIRRPHEYKYLYINLILFIITFIGLSLWNIFLNHDTYGQFFLFKDSWIGAGIGLMMGYFGFSIALFIAKLVWPKSDSLPLIKYPELYFENDFIKKLKKKRNFYILMAAFVFSFILWLSLKSILLPDPPLENFSYYDSETDQEIEHSRVYSRNFSKVRLGINKKILETEKHLYVAGLKYDKKNDLTLDYYKFTIEDSLNDDKTFKFDELASEKELEEIKKHIFDRVFGRKINDDNIRLKFNSKEKKIIVTRRDCLNESEIKDELTKFYKKIITKNFDINTFITDRDGVLCSYKDEFLRSIGSRSVCADELLQIYEFYSKQMNTSYEKDIKRMALIWCQLHTSVGFNIKFTGSHIKRILEIFESYYKKNNIKSISDINKRITRIYLRLLLYIEKNFAEDDAYSIIHDSISRVLDSSGSEYYLFYLEESVRNNVLFEPLVDASVVSLRAAFFNEKREIFRKLKKAKTILKEIYNLKEADERSKAFINSLIEELTPKPAVSITKEKENSKDLLTN